VAAYLATPVNYTATCTFTFSLPVTSTPAQSDAITYQNQVAANEVQQAARADIYSGPAAAAGLDAATAASEVSVTQVPNSSNFVLVATDSNGDRAKNLANRMCDTYVQRVAAQIQQARDAEVSQLESKITQLQQSIALVQATPPQQRSPSDQSFLQAQQKAVDADQQLLATTLALPPDNVSVVTQAPAGVRADTRSIGRNLLVAAIAAVLACFLVVLFGEMARDVRPRS
jgi:hypothetical protein